MQRFKRGDVVVLKSGGPLMTVRHQGGDSYTEPSNDIAITVSLGMNVVECAWFVRVGDAWQLFDARFTEDALRPPTLAELGPPTDR